jgi:hypothetical protein
MAQDFDALVEDAVKQARPKLAVATVALPQGFKGGAMAAGGATKFCELWPVVKSALEVLQTFVPAAAIFVGIIIRIGDGVCKP